MLWYNFFGDFMLIDTHCHLSYNDYPNLDEIINNMQGIMIISGCNDETNKEVLDIVSKYKNVYGTLGLHPEEIDNVNEKSLKFIEENLSNPKIVAVGEIGLDYYWINDNKEKQKKLFESQLELAQKYNLPVIIHSREAISDTYDIVKKYKLKGTIHSFSSSTEMAYKFIQLGYKIGVGGVVTFKNGRRLQEVVSNIDISNILIETDSPYLTPEPFRGRKNEPKNVYFVAQKIAEIKNKPVDFIIENTGKNAIDLFDLKL